MDEIHFEWDEAKDVANQIKHGVSFREAARVFDDPLMLLIPDGHSEGEERWRAFGQIGGVAIIMTAHTYRMDETSDGAREKIRIISARRATKHERQKYEHENG